MRFFNGISLTEVINRRALKALCVSIFLHLLATSAGQAAAALPLSLAQLRVLERFASEFGVKDVQLNKAMTDGLGITAASDGPMTAGQIANESQGRVRHFSFLPQGKGYLLMSVGEESVGIYHLWPSLQMGKAFGRDGNSGALRYLTEERARKELTAELRVWATLADEYSRRKK